MSEGKKNDRQQQLLREKRLLRQRRASLAERIHHASFRIYGLDDQTVGFTVRTFSTRGFPEEPASIGFVFANSTVIETKDVLRIESADPHEVGILYPAPHEAVTSKFNLHHSLFHQYYLDHELPQFADQFSRWEGTITISDELFSGEIYYWLQPYQLTLFLFEGNNTHLIGDTFGLSLDQLLIQLQQLVPLNEREDLLVRYQRELQI